MHYRRIILQKLIFLFLFTLHAYKRNPLTFIEIPCISRDKYCSMILSRGRLIPIQTQASHNFTKPQRQTVSAHRYLPYRVRECGLTIELISWRIDNRLASTARLYSATIIRRRKFAEIERKSVRARVLSFQRFSM